MRHGNVCGGLSLLDAMRRADVGLLVLSSTAAVYGEPDKQPVAGQMGPRRPGDPATLVASSAHVSRELGWKPASRDLRTIVVSAWRWMR